MRIFRAWNARWSLSCSVRPGDELSPDSDCESESPCLLLSRDGRTVYVPVSQIRSEPVEADAVSMR